MAWRAIPGPLSKRKRRLDSLEAAQGGICFAASAHYNQPYPSFKTKCKICPIFGKKSLTFQVGIGAFSELSQSLSHLYHGPSLAQSSLEEVSAVLKLLYILTWVLLSWVHLSLGLVLGALFRLG